MVKVIGAAQAIALAAFWGLAYFNAPPYLDVVLVGLAPVVCVLAVVGLWAIWRPLLSGAVGGLLRAAVILEILCFATAVLIGFTVYLLATFSFG